MTENQPDAYESLAQELRAKRITYSEYVKRLRELDRGTGRQEFFLRMLGADR
jgi:hypothetical protein